MKTIEIEINPDGSLEIETKGFNDSGCLDILKDIEKMFGLVTDLKYKPEAHRVKVDGKVRS